MVTCKEVIDILIKIGEVIEENKLYLSELDAAIGDGDHGLNMDKGFRAVAAKVKELPQSDLGMILKDSAMALLSSVGGASGPLYGTAFMKASVVVSKKEKADINDFISMLREALNGIKMRGKSKEGEKTMIDTLNPAFEEGRKALEKGYSEKDVLNIIKVSAEEGMKSTIAMRATKGRASYLGERSVGHPDAGATSMCLILSTIVDELTREDNK